MLMSYHAVSRYEPSARALHWKGFLSLRGCLEGVFAFGQVYVNSLAALENAPGMGLRLWEHTASAQGLDFARDGSA